MQSDQPLETRLKQHIRDIPDYPKPGVIFKDITPVLANPALMKDAADTLYAKATLLRPDAVVGIEARGFIFGSLLAYRLGCAFVPVRKVGKLPFRTVAQHYDLEYGSTTVEIHEDAICPGWRVLVHDDLLATGGTSVAAAELVQKLKGSVVGFSFLICLGFLEGEEKIRKRFGLRPDCLVKF
jgi:adenine phosphoribosyltransferase